jgi:Tol biopolymer transport system component
VREHILTRGFRHLRGITVIAALLVFACTGTASAQSPPTGLVSINRFSNGSGDQPALNNALSVSADGRYVAFVGEASDLAPNDANNAADVFVRDRQTGRTILVDVNAAGTGPADQGAGSPTITPDGRYVAFVSASSNLVTDAGALGTGNVYVRDLQSGVTTLVSRNFAGTGGGNGTSGWFDPLGISADGRYVVFTSSATNLVAAVDNNNQTDVFVRDLQSGTTALVSVNRNGGTSVGGDESDGAVLTPDGRFVAFMSEARDLLPLDSGFRRQVFVRDLQTGVTTLATPSRFGTGGADGDTDARRERDMAISSDGRYVAFVSDADDLVDNDKNLAQDVFVRDTKLGVTTLVSVRAGTASGNATSGQLAMSPDGRFVAFVSAADDIVAGLDTNQQQDVFVKDMQTNTTSLVSLNRSGVAGGNGNGPDIFISSFLRASISDDGRYVSFTSSASDLTPANDTNGGNPNGFHSDVFVRDRLQGVTTPVSLNYSGTDTGKGNSGYPLLAHDGKSIFYFSGASDLVGYDTNGGVQDLFAFVNVQDAGQIRFKTAVASASESAGAANVTASLAGPLPTAASVEYSTVGGTAMAGTDYVPTSGTLTFAPGEIEKTFSIPLIDDAADEDDETIVVRLAGQTGAAKLGEPSVAAVLIADDDPPPLLSISDASVGEGDGRNDGMTFVIKLSQPSLRTVSVAISTQAVTATPGVNFAPGTDFNQTSGVMTFPPGATWGLLTIGIVPDTVPEPDETFKVVLSNPVNAKVARGEGVGTIIDDDGPTFTKVQFTAGAFTTSEAAGRIDFQVTRTGDLSSPSVVSYQTGPPGSASNRTDYTYSQGTLHFAPNETSKTFSVYITNDAYKENDETFSVVLYGPVGCTLGSPAFAVVTIQSDDPADGPSPVGTAFNTGFYVRQHYLDFLGREPDAAGLAFWTNEINSCGADAQCREVKLVNVSAAFFLSIEFQETGFLAYRTYKAAYGNFPGEPVPITLPEFLVNMRQIGDGVVVNQGDWQARLEQNKRDYFASFVGTLTFPLIYPATLTPAQFVDAFFANAGVTPTAAERNAAIGEFSQAADTSDRAARARALRDVAENPALVRQEFNRAFVLMQYYGYLRRNPYDPPETGRNFDGYNFWLSKLNQFNGNFIQAEMVKAFITSTEYRQRFGQP